MLRLCEILYKTTKQVSKVISNFVKTKQVEPKFNIGLKYLILTD